MKTLTVDELAAILRVGRQAIYYWIYADKCPVPYIKTQNRVLFDARDVEEYLEKNKKIST